MEELRRYLIERLSRDGKIEELKRNLNTGYTQEEINIALGNAIAYSHIKIAKYLISKGADISHWNFDGVYYSVHNNEIEGLKFAIKQGVDVNVNRGQLLNTAIITAYNTKDFTILKYLLANGADTKLLSKETIDSFGTDEIKNIVKNAK
ncbi:hypothetical protein [Aquimarina rhabdastrellae]